MKVKKLLLKAVVLFVAVWGIALATNLFEDEALWIDVRSVAEYQADHISGHLNVPYTALAEKIGGLAEDKNIQINLYCRSGRRAGLALQRLKRLGYNKVINHGGIADVRRELNAAG